MVLVEKIRTEDNQAVEAVFNFTSRKRGCYQGLEYLARLVQVAVVKAKRRNCLREACDNLEPARAKHRLVVRVAHQFKSALSRREGKQSHITLDRVLGEDQGLDRKALTRMRDD